MALSTKLEEVKECFIITSNGRSIYSFSGCCSFIHNYQPKQKFELYLYLNKADIRQSEETVNKWLKVLKSIGFKFEFLYKKGILVVGINNQDYTTSWQMYLLYCLIRWIFYNGDYKNLILKTFEVKKELPSMTWFECMQVAHGLPYKTPTGEMYHTGSMSMYTGSASYMVKLVPIKEFLAKTDFAGGMNLSFHKNIIYLMDPPSIESFKNQKKAIKLQEEYKQKTIDEAIREIKEYKGYKSCNLYTLETPYSNLTTDCVLRDPLEGQRSYPTVKEVVWPVKYRGSYITNAKKEGCGIMFPPNYKFKKIEIK